MSSRRVVGASRETSARGRRWLVAAAVVLAGPLAASLSGCSTAPAPAAGLAPGRVDVVASTDVWGSVSSAIGGRWVSVTSVISRPDQDPHSFEGSARVLLAVKEADLIVANGGGYDYFMDQMIDASGTAAPVVNAVRASGHQASPGAPLNEHVWYDVRGVAKVAHAVAMHLSALAPRHAAAFAANERSFDAGLDRLVEAENQARAAYAGTGVAVTEPVPLYLLSAMGLHNRTPAAFSDAVEEGGDVAVRVLAETLDLFSRHQVAALVYNDQTDSPVTEQVRRAAVAAGVPVVPVSETLPSGSTYLSWMARNVAAVTRALDAR